jgi:hypothetical protein
MTNKINMDIFTNKRILFYGPANTLDKPFLNINDYDYIIITNNLITRFFDKYKLKPHCKVIHLCNQLYTLNYINNLWKYEKNIYFFLFINKKSLSYAEKYLERQKLCQLPLFSINKKIPLGLSRILNFLKNTNFKELYITGCTFYNEKKIEDCYEVKYMIKEGKKNNIFSADKTKHSLQDNINYVKNICKNNKNIILCEELLQILY